MFNPSFGRRDSYSRPLSFLQGNQPLNGTGVLAEGPGMGGAEVYAFPEWATMSDVQRVAVMREMVNEYAPDPRFGVMVAGLMRQNGIQARDWPRISAMLLTYVHDSVTYVNEPGERLVSPWRTLQWKMGDCDDMVILYNTLLSSVGIPNKFVLVGRRRNGRLVRWVEGFKMPKGVDFFHVSSEVWYPPGGGNVHRVPAETTMAGAPLGYDLVKHGIVVDGHGRPDLEKTLQGMNQVRAGRPIGGQAQQSGGSFYGSFGQDIVGGEEEEPGVLATFFTTSFWQSLVIESTAAVITAVAIAVALDYYERRKRKRR